MDLRTADLVPATWHSVLCEDASCLIQRCRYESNLVFIPVKITDLSKVTLYSQLCLPLVGVVGAFPLVHRTAISVCQDLVNVTKEHRAKVGVLVADHGSESRVN